MVCSAIQISGWFATTGKEELRHSGPWRLARWLWWVKVRSRIPSCGVHDVTGSCHRWMVKGNVVLDQVLSVPLGARMDVDSTSSFEERFRELDMRGLVGRFKELGCASLGKFAILPCKQSPGHRYGRPKKVVEKLCGIQTGMNHRTHLISAVCGLESTFHPLRDLHRHPQHLLLDREARQEEQLGATWTQRTSRSVASSGMLEVNVPRWTSWEQCTSCSVPQAEARQQEDACRAGSEVGACSGCGDPHHDPLSAGSIIRVAC